MEGLGGGYFSASCILIGNRQNRYQHAVVLAVIQ
jgi:hypothetical protein